MAFSFSVPLDSLRTQMEQQQQQQQQHQQTGSSSTTTTTSSSSFLDTITAGGRSTTTDNNNNNNSFQGGSAAQSSPFTFGLSTGGGSSTWGASGLSGLLDGLSSANFASSSSSSSSSSGTNTLGGDSNSDVDIGTYLGSLIAEATDDLQKKTPIPPASFAPATGGPRTTPSAKPSSSPPTQVGGNSGTAASNNHNAATQHAPVRPAGAMMRPPPPSQMGGHANAINPMNVRARPGVVPPPNSALKQQQQPPFAGNSSTNFPVANRAAPGTIKPASPVRPVPPASSTSVAPRPNTTATSDPHAVKSSVSILDRLVAMGLADNRQYANALIRDGRCFLRGEPVRTHMITVAVDETEVTVIPANNNNNNTSAGPAAVRNVAPPPSGPNAVNTTTKIAPTATTMGSPTKAPLKIGGPIPTTTTTTAPPAPPPSGPAMVLSRRFNLPLLEKHTEALDFIREGNVMLAGKTNTNAKFVLGANPSILSLADMPLWRWISLKRVLDRSASFELIARCEGAVTLDGRPFDDGLKMVTYSEFRKKISIAPPSAMSMLAYAPEKKRRRQGSEGAESSPANKSGAGGGGTHFQPQPRLHSQQHHAGNEDGKRELVDVLVERNLARSKHHALWLVNAGRVTTRRTASGEAGGVARNPRVRILPTPGATEIIVSPTPKEQEHSPGSSDEERKKYDAMRAFCAALVAHMRSRHSNRGEAGSLLNSCLRAGSFEDERWGGGAFSPVAAVAECGAEFGLIFRERYREGGANAAIGWLRGRTPDVTAYDRYEVVMMDDERTLHTLGNDASLENVALRRGLARDFLDARVLLARGLFALNGRRVDIKHTTSPTVAPDDVLSIADDSLATVRRLFPRAFSPRVDVVEEMGDLGLPRARALWALAAVSCLVCNLTLEALSIGCLEGNVGYLFHDTRPNGMFEALRSLLSGVSRLVVEKAVADGQARWRDRLALAPHPYKTVPITAGSLVVDTRSEFFWPLLTVYAEPSRAAKFVETFESRPDSWDSCLTLPAYLEKSYSIAFGLAPGNANRGIDFHKTRLNGITRRSSTPGVRLDETWMGVATRELLKLKEKNFVF